MVVTQHTPSLIICTYTHAGIKTQETFYSFFSSPTTPFTPKLTHTFVVLTPNSTTDTHVLITAHTHTHTHSTL
jgi:hypothetical protein